MANVIPALIGIFQLAITEIWLVRLNVIDRMFVQDLPPLNKRSLWDLSPMDPSTNEAFHLACQVWDYTHCSHCSLFKLSI